VNTLPEPNFIDRDPAVIRAEMIAQFEALTGKKLQPAQVEMPMIQLFAYRESLVRIAIQEAAKQNLARYAAFPMLDYLGSYKGVDRLDATPATAPGLVTLTGVQPLDVLVPAGTRVVSKDGKYTFGTRDALTIVAGQTAGAVVLVCEATGLDTNGYLAGEIATILDPVVNVASIANIDTSSGGADLEEDEPYRARIEAAPEGFSTAGPLEAYQFFARAAHPTIIDVAVISPVPGTVQVFPLVDTGTPSSAVLDAVEAALNDEKVRPISDTPLVTAPTRRTYTITGNLTVYTKADANAVLAAVLAQLQAHATKLRTQLAQDIVPEHISGLANTVEGTYRFQLTSPAALVAVAANEWADCTAIAVSLVGASDG
jgi:phage-related baseplate assembly protein